MDKKWGRVIPGSFPTSLPFLPETPPDPSQLEGIGENLSDKILSDAVGLLYGQTAKGLVATLLSASVLALVQSRVVDDMSAFGWLGAIVIITALRSLLLFGFRHSQTREERPLLWRNLFIAGALAAALAWGSASVLLFTPTSIAHQTFLSFTLAGVAAAATPILSPSLATAGVFLSLTLLPLAVRFLMQESEIQIAMGSMTVVLLLFLLSVARGTREIILFSLALRHANLHSVEYLAGAKERAESANQQLQVEIQQRREIEKQLEKARNDAEQASKSKGDFLATISHEIRTPMNGVLGALELVEDLPLGKEQRELIVTAHKSTESLIGIINDVLDFSKIEGGRLELEDIEIDVRRLVDEVTSLLGKRAANKGLELTHKIQIAVPDSLKGDPTRLRQILNNLVGNAVKFTEQGKIEVRVGVVRNTPASVLLRFEVEDTGIGMNPAVRASLFQPFTQADSSMARKFGGTGLGLSISKRLVELMGGRIGVQSQRGMGSTFWFTVSLAKPEKTARRLRADLSGTLLLILTTDQALRTQLKADVKGWGANVEFTSSAARTLNKLKSPAQIGDSYTYNAVIVDVTSEPARILPLVSEIRSNKRLTGTPIVAVGTAPGEQEILEEVVDVCLPTPMSSQELFDALTELIEGPPFLDYLGVDTAATTSEADLIMPESSHKPSGAGSESETSKIPALQDSNKEMPLDEDKQVQERSTGGIQTVAPEKLALPVFRGRALVAEDNRVNQKVAKRVVERLGLSVDLVNDGNQAVEAFMKGTYDVVLMDWQMPGMDGLQATRAIRRIERNHKRNRVPIIAVTANAIEGDRERCLEAGTDDYMAKPFKKEALLDLLVKWLPEEAAGKPSSRMERVQAQPEPVTKTKSVANRPKVVGRILVADDNEVNRKLARATLERFGYSVELAANGREAIALARANGFDAILMDCEMPEIDGFEATREIRQIEQRNSVAHTPILALTGHTEKSDRERCLQAGMDDVLTKPIKRDSLAEALRQHVCPLQTNPEVEDMKEMPPAAATGPALDKEILSELKDIMEDEFDSLIQAFIEDAPTRIYTIRNAIQAHDIEAVRVAAHTLKSSAANLGAVPLSTQAKELEMLTREGKLTGAAELLKQIAEEYKRVRSELKAL